jgi:hypothetical protein
MIRSLVIRFFKTPQLLLKDDTIYVLLTVCVIIPTVKMDKEVYILDLPRTVFVYCLSEEFVIRLVSGNQVFSLRPVLMDEERQERATKRGLSDTSTGLS